MADYAVKITIFLELSWEDSRLSAPGFVSSSDIWAGFKI